MRVIQNNSSGMYFPHSLGFSLHQPGHTTSIPAFGPLISVYARAYFSTASSRCWRSASASSRWRWASDTQANASCTAVILRSWISWSSRERNRSASVQHWSIRNQPIVFLRLQMPGLEFPPLLFSDYAHIKSYLATN